MKKWQKKKRQKGGQKTNKKIIAKATQCDIKRYKKQQKTGRKHDKKFKYTLINHKYKPIIFCATYPEMTLSSFWKGINKKS